MADQTNAGSKGATIDLESPTEVTLLVEALRARAEKAREDAAHSGAHNDGGARELEREVNVWLAGRAWALPALSTWHEVAAQVAARQDPEWETYKRLHEKFSGAKV